ncbi:MAG: adenine phosphoribosyltransferase [Gemmatimonadaceae bacterium]|nr:adenine phosphoribosyltransferase [Gloeobacterales cyanobacterium ES-bin-141]
MDLKAHIRDIPDFPEPGIVFRDITPLLKEPDALHFVIDSLADVFGPSQIDYVCGIESRGFIVGAPLACKLSCGFVPIRKPGKLPAAVHSCAYTLEYGTNSLEIHQDAFASGSGCRVLIVDDLLATGGTAAAANMLVEKAGGTLVGFGFIIELTFLGGRLRLPGDVPVAVLVSY